jgi:hypothetical protein
MKSKKFTLTPANTDDNGLAEAQTLAGAGAATLNGALIASGSFTSSDGMGRRIGVTSAGDDTGITFTIVGTDPDGKAITEVLTGVNANVATSTGYFKTVSSVTASGATDGDITVGTVDEARSKVIPTDAASSIPVQVVTDISGTIDYTVGQSVEKFQEESNTRSTTFPALASFVGETADEDATGFYGGTGVRATINSFTNGATLVMYVGQPSGR